MFFFERANIIVIIISIITIIIEIILSSSTTSPSSSSSSAVHLPSNLNHSSTEPTERILRNGKRRGTYSTVTPSAASKSDSFKIPEAPPTKSDEILNAEKLIDTGSGAPSSSSTSVNDEDDTNSISGEKTLVRNGVDDETGDNCSSRSVSPTTSGDEHNIIESTTVDSRKIDDEYG